MEMEEVHFFEGLSFQEWRTLTYIIQLNQGLTPSQTETSLEKLLAEGAVDRRFAGDVVEYLRLR